MTEKEALDPLELARSVLRREGSSINDVANRLDKGFIEAVDLMLNTKGRVIVTGMGKSGHVGRKISATLISTGTPSYFLHPAESGHGDIGIVTSEDIVLAISHSGETEEILELIPTFRRFGARIISITAERGSNLARSSDICIATGPLSEADSHNVIPTTSTTVALALGDALAMVLMKRRGFSMEDFAQFHPSGMLGKELTLRVRDLLEIYGARTGKGISSLNPIVEEDATFRDAISVITKFGLGATSVVNPEGKLVGIITDGDIRRLMEASRGPIEEIMARRVDSIMTRNPKQIEESALAREALKLMETGKLVQVLPVTDGKGIPVGMIHIHNLVREGFRTRL